MIHLSFVCLAALTLAQEVRVGIIDFYGLRRVRDSDARAVLNIREGDVLQMGAGKPEAMTTAERRIAALPGVIGAQINAVCCDNGRVILYIGVVERGSTTLRFRDPPRDSVSLPGDVVELGEQLSTAMMNAVMRGDAGEDDSNGHALMHDPAGRAIQERFIAYAATNQSHLRRVLRRSSSPDHRALAAQILGYVPDKRTVVDDLVFAVGDRSESVRNNAIRALAVIAGFATRTHVPNLNVPYEPFISLLNSPVWTDRNKASMAIASFTEQRDPNLLRALRTRALDSLTEMARWKSEGHADAAFRILGRIGNLPEDAIQAAWDRRDRETVINAARAAK